MRAGVVELFIGTAAFAVCVLILVRPRRRRRPWSTVLQVAAAVLALGGAGTIGWGAVRAFSLMQFLSPRVGAIRRADAAEVRAVEVLPRRGSSCPSLLDRPVRLDDRATIAEIVRRLRSATPWQPSDPSPQWRCVLALDFGGRKSRCVATSTIYEGTLIAIHAGSRSGRLLGQYRDDGLGEFLAARVKAAKASRPLQVGGRAPP